jgi:hypothetical protein
MGFRCSGGWVLSGATLVAPLAGDDEPNPGGIRRNLRTRIVQLDPEEGPDGALFGVRLL